MCYNYIFICNKKSDDFIELCGSKTNKIKLKWRSSGTRMHRLLPYCRWSVKFGSDWIQTYLFSDILIYLLRNKLIFGVLWDEKSTTLDFSSTLHVEVWLFHVIHTITSLLFLVIFFLNIFILRAGSHLLSYKKLVKLHQISLWSDSRYIALIYITYV